MRRPGEGGGRGGGVRTGRPPATSQGFFFFPLSLLRLGLRLSVSRNRQSTSLCPQVPPFGFAYSQYILRLLLSPCVEVLVLMVLESRLRAC